MLNQRGVEDLRGMVEHRVSLALNVPGRIKRSHAETILALIAEYDRRVHVEALVVERSGPLSAEELDQAFDAIRAAIQQCAGYEGSGDYWTEFDRDEALRNLDALGITFTRKKGSQ